MKNTLPDWLVYGMSKALIGEIYPAIRAIAIRFDESRTMLIRYYLDRAPLEMDDDSIEMVILDFENYFTPDMITKIDIECQFSLLPISKLDSLNGFVYARREWDLEEVMP